MKLKFSASLGSLRLEFRLWRRKESGKVIGVNSTLKDGKHILMIDYDDNLPLKDLVREIKRLQNKFGLGTAHIFESSFEKYFVFFFHERLDYFRALRIIHDTPCCKEFKKYRMLRDEMTLRLTPKSHQTLPPRLVGVIKGRRKNLREDQEAIMNLVFSLCEVKEKVLLL